MVWKNQSNQEDNLPDGQGVSFTLEHEGFIPGEYFVTRFAWSDGDAASVSRFFMFAWGKEIRKYDHLGIGISTGKSAFYKNTWQTASEIYYRWQVTKELMITPDLQVILGDGDNPGDDGNIHVVAGIRAGISL